MKLDPKTVAAFRKRVELIKSTGRYNDDDIVSAMDLLVELSSWIERLRSAASRVCARPEKQSTYHLLVAASAYAEGKHTANPIAQEIMDGIAEVGREIHNERMRRAIAERRAQGLRWGRPPTPIITEEAWRTAVQLRANGVSLRKISKELGISKSTAHRYFLNEKAVKLER